MTHGISFMPHVQEHTYNLAIVYIHTNHIHTQCRGKKRKKLKVLLNYTASLKPIWVN